ncbi:MAG: ferrous iron transport protein A [Bacilli bacterium]|nr:ferrous iron transport protein A [Bacilli bacterium]
MYLSDMKIGDKARVLKVDSNEYIKRRLLDIGLIENTCVECVLKSGFDGMLAYLIRGAVIAIRKDDINKIEVELV